VTQKILQVALFEGSDRDQLEAEVNEFLSDFAPEDIVRYEAQSLQDEDRYPLTHITLWYRDDAQTVSGE